MARNNNATALKLDPLDRHKVAMPSPCICLVTIVGNFLVVFVVNINSQLKGITNVFIHNLAWMDICIAVLNMPFWIVSLYNGRWMFSDTHCHLAASLLFTLGIASILNMGLIAVNRYLKVVKSNIYRKVFPSKRTARVYCIAVWSVSLLLSTTPLYGWGAMEYHAHFALCCLVWEIGNISYIIVVVGVVVNGVTCVVFYCYYKIYCTVKASSASLASHAAHENVLNTTLNNMTQTTDIKLLKATFAVVCVFVVCWAPISLVVLCETIFGLPPRVVNAVVVYLMFCSSGANPVIYGLMNPQFKRAFAKVLRCKKNENDGAPSSGLQEQDPAPITPATNHTSTV